MSVIRAYVGNTPTVLDTIYREDGSAADLTGATVTFVYRPEDLSAPEVSLTATPDPDQVANKGSVSIRLGTPLMSAPADWVWWWHVVFIGGEVLDSTNNVLLIESHGPGATPYLTPSRFRRITRVKMAKLGIAAGGDGDELLQTEIDRAAVYVEFVTGQPATNREQPVAATYSTTVSPTSTGVLIEQAIQMRTEQVTFQSQNGYVDDASDDVISNFSVGGYSQSKNDAGRRGEQRQLNSWQALGNLLWLLMTPDRFQWWVLFLSGNAELMLGPSYSFENTIEPGWIDGWGYGFGAADVAFVQTGGGLLGRGYTASIAQVDPYSGGAPVDTESW